MDNFVVQVKNLGLIEKAKLEFVPGLNVIRGPSSSGKSTLLRGIEDTIYNTPGDASVTYNKTLSAVNIVYKGHSVLRRKDLSDKENKTVYKVDDKGYTKLGRNALPEVVDSLGFPEIKLIDSKMHINFSPQFSVPFLVDETPPRIFEFIAVSDSEVNLTGILRDMRADLDEQNLNKKVSEASLNTLQKLISSEKPVVALLSDYTKLFDEIIKLQGTEDKRVALSELISEIEDNLKLGRQYSYERKLLSEVLKGFDDTILDKQYEQLQSLKTLVSTVYYLSQECDRSDNELKEIESRLNIVEFIGSELDRLEETICNKRDNRDSLSKIVESLTSIRESGVNIKEEMNKVNSELDSVNSELSEFKICPLCGQPLESEHGTGCNSQV